MGKYVLKARDDAAGTVIDADSLERWIDTVRAADRGDSDATDVLVGQSVYIADRFADLIDYTPDDDAGVSR